jgi:hypothetical protein
MLMFSNRTFPAVACLLATSACSWITVAKPPAGPVDRGEKLTCTSSVAAPVTDTVVGSAALLFGATGVGAGAAGLGCDVSTCWIQEPVAVAYLTLGVALVGVAVMEAFSAAYGYGQTARCRELEQAQLACVSGVEPSCASIRDGGAPAAR